MRVGIDMDGTIADFISLAIAKANDLYGLNLSPDNIHSSKIVESIWQGLGEERRTKYKEKEEIYAELCPKGFFLEIQPYPKAIEAVKELAARKDIEIVFVTKPLNWDRSAEEKVKWLEKYFKGIDYTFIMVNKFEDKRFINLDVMVDDDSRVLDALESTVPLLIKQPYNARDEKKYAFRANDMTDAKNLIILMDEASDWWKKKGLK